MCIVGSLAAVERYTKKGLHPDFRVFSILHSWNSLELVGRKKNTLKVAIKRLNREYVVGIECKR